MSCIRVIQVIQSCDRINVNCDWFLLLSVSLDNRKVGKHGIQSFSVKRLERSLLSLKLAAICITWSSRCNERNMNVQFTLIVAVNLTLFCVKCNHDGAWCQHSSVKRKHVLKDYWKKISNCFRLVIGMTTTETCSLRLCWSFKVIRDWQIQRELSYHPNKEQGWINRTEGTQYKFSTRVGEESVCRPADWSLAM